jgi:translation initiation factor IF-3
MHFEKNKYFINNKIRANLVRVTHENNQLGVMPIKEALNYSFQRGLDLILINSQTNPPLCIVEEFGKFKYENKIKEKEVRKKQKEAVVVIKEVRMTPTISDHDLQTKLKSVISFLESGKSVQVQIRFSHRELNHKEIGIQKIDIIIESTKNIASIEQKPSFFGKSLVCKLVPLRKKNGIQRNDNVKQSNT